MKTGKVLKATSTFRMAGRYKRAKCGEVGGEGYPYSISNTGKL